MIKLNGIENAILHIVDMNKNVKKFIYQEWNEELTNEQKFDVMVQAIQMQKRESRKGEN